MLVSFLRSIDRDVTREMNIGRGHALPYEERTAKAAPKLRKKLRRIFCIFYNDKRDLSRATGA